MTIRLNMLRDVPDNPESQTVLSAGSRTAGATCAGSVARVDRRLGVRGTGGTCRAAVDDIGAAADAYED
jgi:hypothetical protein